MNTVNYIASIFSILSAIFSFVIFLKNRTIKKEIVKHNMISKLTEYSSKSNAIITSIEKYSARNGKKIALDFNKLIENLKKYYKLAKGMEKSLKKQEIVKELNEIKIFIDNFSMCDKNPYSENMSEINAIYFTVIDMDSKIRDELDNKIHS